MGQAPSGQGGGPPPERDPEKEKAIKAREAKELMVQQAKQRALERAKARKKG